MGDESIKGAPLAPRIFATSDFNTVSFPFSFDGEVTLLSSTIFLVACSMAKSVGAMASVYMTNSADVKLHCLTTGYSAVVRQSLQQLGAFFIP